jgi:hypothetical protein
MDVKSEADLPSFGGVQKTLFLIYSLMDVESETDLPSFGGIQKQGS